MANTSGLSSTPFGNLEALEGHGLGRPKGIPNKITQEGRGFAKTFVDDPRWEEMIWTWVEGVSSRRVEDIVMAALRGEITPEDCAKQVRAAATPMPAGVFNCIMMYRFGKPPQTVKLKGAFGAKPYDDMTETELAARAAALAVELTATEKPEASE
jgi:hypothetical protein